MIMNKFHKLFQSKGKGSPTKGVQMAKGYDTLSMLDQLAGARMNSDGSTVGGDITKWEKIYKIGYITCLNQLALWNAKDEFIEANRTK